MRITLEVGELAHLALAEDNFSDLNVRQMFFSSKKTNSSHLNVKRMFFSSKKTNFSYSALSSHVTMSSA